MSISSTHPPITNRRLICYDNSLAAKINKINDKIGPLLQTFILKNTLDSQEYECPTTVLDDKKPNYGLEKLDNLTYGYISGPDEELKLHFKEPLDILFVYEWPKVFQKQSSTSNEAIEEIIRVTQPQYIFSHGSFYEMQPFKWMSGRVSRFISLGDPSKKEKWFYAFTIETGKTEFSASNLTTNLFEAVPKQAAEAAPKQTSEAAPCFFCLSNNVNTYMIVSIGKLAYLTIAKGPLTLKTPQSISGHVLIIPISHTIYPDQNTLDEINQTQISLTEFFLSLNLGCASFEVVTKKSMHFNRQVLPIPLDCSLRRFQQFLKITVTRHNKRQDNCNLKFETIKALELPEYKKKYQDYMVLELSFLDNYQPENVVMIAQIDSSKRIDFQLPRRVLAGFLGLKDRVFWNKCAQLKQEEEQEVLKFRELYEK